MQDMDGKMYDSNNSRNNNKNNSNSNNSNKNGDDDDDRILNGVRVVQPLCLCCSALPQSSSELIPIRRYFFSRDNRLL